MKMSLWLLTFSGWMLVATGARAQDDPKPPAAEATAGDTPAPAEKPRPRDPFASSLQAKSDPFAGEVTNPAPRCEGPKNLVSLNLLGALGGNYQMDYQRAISSHFSLLLSPSFRRISTTVVPGMDFTVETLGVLAGLAFYFPQKALMGLNIALSGGLLHLESANQDQDPRNTWNIKATIGFRYLFKFGLSLEINLGALLMPEISLYEDSHRVIAYVNGGPVMELGLGWVF